MSKNVIRTIPIFRLIMMYAFLVYCGGMAQAQGNSSSALGELQGRMPMPSGAAALKGDYSIALKMKNYKGAPAAGKEFSLLYFNPLKGMDTARTGKLNEKGEGLIANLPGGEGAPVFILETDGDYLEQLQLDGPQKTISLDLQLPCGVGDIAPDIVMIDADSGVPMKLSQLRGQVVFLEFWATWCPPCQEPMAHNNEILKKRGKDWEGKAVILAVSIDRSIAILNRHVGKNRWFALSHKWAGRGGVGLESEQAKTFGVTGVPTALLIDAGGKILWRGHPATIDVEQKIDEALK